MPRYLGFDTAAESPDAPRTTILLINLGTPAAPSVPAVRGYLAEFLSDPRVVELPRWLWWPVLHGYVLRTRPRRSAEAYASIWRDDGSPLLVFSQRLATALDRDIRERTAGKADVALAMTYGEPSLRAVMTALMQQGTRRVLALPLFPQYSATSTGAALDALGRVLDSLRWLPELRTINAYHADEAYISALAGCVQGHWSRHGRGDKLLLSFHGIPEQYAAAGDPYPAQCRETARQLGRALGTSEEDLVVTFQSRLGRQPWLKPYTDQTIKEFARQRVATLDVLCPGFAVDCLETLEEIELRYRAQFLANGGQQFRYIPALNDSAAHVSALSGIAMRELAGWL